MIRWFVISIVFFPLFTWGQNIGIQWIYKYTYAFNGNAVEGIPDRTGAYYLLGTYLDTVCFSGQAVLCKINDHGNLEWDSEYLNDTTCISESLNKMKLLGDDVVLTGMRQNGWLIKIDSSDGHIIRQANGGLNFSAVCLRNGNRLFVTSPPGSILYCYDTAGVFLWSQPFPSLYAPSTTDAVSNSINQTNYFLSAIQDTGTGEAQGIGVTGIDYNGNFVFDTIINYHNNSDPDYPVKIVNDQYGDLYTLSKDMTSNGIYLNKLELPGPSIINATYQPLVNCTPQSISLDTVNEVIYADARTADGYRIVKFDYQLQLLDTISMDTAMVSSEAVGVTPDGHLCVAYRPFGQDKELYLLIYDFNGTCVGSSSYLDTTWALSPKWVQFDTLGNIFVAGSASDGQGHNSGFVINYNSTVGIDEETQYASVNIQPNPATDEVTITIGEVACKSHLRILNANGLLEVETPFVGESIEINTSEFSPGLYIIEITTDNGQLFISKLIVNHQ